MDKRFELKNISNSRGFIMGIATLLVMFFHTYIDYYEIIGNNFFANLIDFLHFRGNIGVDIFLLLSGIGLYFSYKKNKLLTFYKNRFIRVVPAYLLVTVSYFLYLREFDKIFSVLSFTGFIINGDRFLWYIQLILILYVVFPIIYKVIDRYRFGGLFISLCGIILFNTMYSLINMRGYENVEIALTRIPVFLIGTYLGKMINDNKTISKNMIFFSLITAILIYILIYFWFNGYRFMFVQRYLYCILAICLVILITYLYSCVKNKTNFVFKIICFLGKYSLEIYLLHDIVSRILLNNVTVLSIMVLTVISFVVSIILAIILKNILNSWIYVFSKLFTLKKLDK